MKEKECEYCKGEDNIYTDGEWSVYVLKNKLNISVVDYEGECREVTPEIKYCPMCGKSLGNGD